MGTAIPREGSGAQGHSLWYFRILDGIGPNLAQFKTPLFLGRILHLRVAAYLWGNQAVVVSRSRCARKAHISSQGSRRDVGQPSPS